MNETQLDLKRSEAFERLGRRYKKARFVWSAKKMRAAHNVATTIYLLAISGNFALACYSDTKSIFMATGIGLGVAFAAHILGGAIKEFTHIRPEHFFVQKLLSYLGIHAPINLMQADNLAEWVNEYPEVRDVCVAWAVRHTTEQLNARDYSVIAKAVNTVEKYQSAHECWMKDFIEQRYVAQKMTECGVLDEAISIKQKNALNQSAPLAAAASSKRRSL